MLEEQNIPGSTEEEIKTNNIGNKRTTVYSEVTIVLDNPKVPQGSCAGISGNLKNGRATFSELLFPRHEKESRAVYQ